MRKKKPIIFWMFAMTDSEQTAVIKNIDDFNNSGVKFITISLDSKNNSFVITTYNLTETESKPYINDIYRQISKHYDIGKVETRA